MSTGLVIVLLILVTIVAVGGYIAQVAEVKDLRADNARLRAHLRRRAGHPAGTALAENFPRALDGARRREVRP